MNVKLTFMIITIIEIIYVYYMLNYFKTKISFNHPYEYHVLNNLSDWFKHPINNLDYNNKICIFGKYMSNILVCFIFFRYLYWLNRGTNKYLYHLNQFVLVLTFILSLMNMNAVIYLLPFFIIEIIITTYL